MSVSNQVGKLFGAFILVLIAVALIPEIFTSLGVMAGNDSIPSWLVVSLTAVVGAGVLFLIWKAVM